VSAIDNLVCLDTHPLDSAKRWIVHSALSVARDLHARAAELTAVHVDGPAYDFAQTLLGFREQIAEEALLRATAKPPSVPPPELDHKVAVEAADAIAKLCARKLDGHCGYNIQPVDGASRTVRFFATVSVLEDTDDWERVARPVKRECVIPYEWLKEPEKAFADVFSGLSK
jgi:hypothetical protein